MVLLLSGGAVVGALLGSREIFSQVLFAWAAIGSAFGPVLLVTVLRGEVEACWRLAAILLGFSLSVGAFYLLPSSVAWKGSLERFFPFVCGLAVAMYGARRGVKMLREDAV